jgi:hypothetical protein
MPVPVPTSELLPPLSVPPCPARGETTTFLDAERARISVTVPRRVLDKLQAARDALELDHVEPRALGGEPTIDNLRVACRDCNQLAARRAFGNYLIDRCARRRDRKRGAVEAATAGHPPRGERMAVGQDSGSRAAAYSAVWRRSSKNRSFARR